MMQQSYLEENFKSICITTFDSKFEKMMNELQKKKLSKEAKSGIFGDGKKAGKTKMKNLIDKFKIGSKESHVPLKNKKAVENKESTYSLIYKSKFYVVNFRYQFTE